MPTSTPWRIAADTGGTFTDCHALAPDGAEHRVKVLSSGVLRASITRAPGPTSLHIAWTFPVPEGFFRGFQYRIVGAGHEGEIVESRRVNESIMELQTVEPIPDALPPESTLELFTGEAAPVLGARLLTHTPPGGSFPRLRFRLATTRATNALLERKGSRVAFFVTRGFGDLLQIGDQRRPDLFALRHAPREACYEAACEVRERLDAQGRVLIPVEETPLRHEAARLFAAGFTTAAVSLLHSDLNPAHEIRVREILLIAGFTHVSLSSELAPFIKILPRAQSAVINAYLTGPVETFIQDVRGPITPASASSAPALEPPAASLHLMTSTGALETAAHIRPKDLLLSGPAGGVIGALNAARRLGHAKIITFDMGGTSTDVARVDGAVSYRFHQQVGGITLFSPAVAIETVAAGGGSVCEWTPSGLTVGPHSAGSDPGPACYGKGGPLTITDVNLLMGRFDPQRAPIPLNREAAAVQADLLLDLVVHKTGREMNRASLLQELLNLATEHMADAIRKISVLEGYDPAEYALLAFGGAGPQHACDVAGKLGMTTILAPRNAGILSAVGLQEALPERFAERQLLKLLNEIEPALPGILDELTAQATQRLSGSLAALPPEARTLRHLAEIRLLGQDTPLQIEFQRGEDLRAAFAAKYAHLFGYTAPSTKPIELVSLRVIAKPKPEPAARADSPEFQHQPGHLISHAAPPLPGPALIQDEFSTLIVATGWSAHDHNQLGWLLQRTPTSAPISNLKSQISNSGVSNPEVHPDLLRHRFHSIVEDMGALLRRTALSTNIRERLDFSCALLTPEGTLISSAPHIPVHLGALGECVRKVMRACELQEGDTVVTNHPAFGGSHLPDVTLITPVYDGRGGLLGFVANRAHHAEIGGLAPGSMPADATSLAEEGVVISPRHLRRNGVAFFEEMRALLTRGPHPTRAPDDNIADLHAQLAANLLGASRLQALHHSISPASAEALDWPAQLRRILDESRRVMHGFIHALPEGSAEEQLDDGARIRVSLRKIEGKLILDFAGTSPPHAGNLNATPAIVRSAVLYVLRLALRENLPLNEGLLADVEIRLPENSFLNPPFHEDPALCPAVVGGNVEVSQRVVDTLIKALGLQACSQGTMNNFVFGNQHFGYYETICGGSGAGDGYNGASALHTHMTNTAITDPEVIERRYPVQLREFSIRRGSGGHGQWSGGDGVIREFLFLAPLTVSLLTQHRNTAPFGFAGGGDGVTGRQTWIQTDGTRSPLAPSATFTVAKGDRVRMETPGGGGWG